MPPRRDVFRAALVVCLLATVLVATGYAFGQTIPEPAASAARRAVGPGAIRSEAPRSTAASSPKPGRSRKATVTDPAGGGPVLPVQSSPGAGRSGVWLETGSAQVALTFDDGPDPSYTPQILDILRKNGVKATFCIIGSRARDYPDLVRRIAGEGHSLCNHSWQHLVNLGERDSGYRNWDLRSTNDAIRAAVPNAQIRYFRAPGGNFTRELVELAGSLGMASIGWSVDPRDWDAATHGRGQSMVSHIVSVIERDTRPGSIVLSHDRARPDTVAAYQTLLPWLKARFQLVALR